MTGHRWTRQQAIVLLAASLRDLPAMADAVATRLHARFAPTVLLLGRSGEALAQRLVGAGIPDFYDAQLERRLAIARSAVRIR
jgi:hypothetical protein